ncbi:hypothetical protein ACHAXS_002397 [Conticribra weissflogii]
MKLLANLCYQKQAGRVWNQDLVSKLPSVGFMQSIIDECIFFCNAYKLTIKTTWDQQMKYLWQSPYNRFVILIYK